MSLVKTECLLLKSTPFKDTSSIVRLFTKSHGKIAVIAKGARRMKNQFRGYLEPLNHLEVIYYYKSTRDIQTLSNVELICNFLKGSRDLPTIIYTTAIIESIDKFLHEHEKNPEIFGLAIAVLKEIDQKKISPKVGLVYFLLKMTGILGYKINFSRCSRCNHNLSSAYYNYHDVQLICDHCCHKNDPYMNKKSLDFLKDLDNIKNIGESTLSPVEESTGLIYFLTTYLGFHLDISSRFKSLEMLSAV